MLQLTLYIIWNFTKLISEGGYTMISFMIEDTKDCMHKLLKENVFNDFLCVGFELISLFKVNIDGQIRHDFLSSDESEIIGDRDYICWEDLKAKAFELIKGNKTPTSMKIIFSLNKQSTASILNRISFSTPDAIGGFNFTLTYENKRMKIITGTNYSTFILDKGAEQSFDDNILKFFKKHNISTLLALD